MSTWSRMSNWLVHGIAPTNAAYDHPIMDPVHAATFGGPVINGHRQPTLLVPTLIPKGPSTSSVVVAPPIPTQPVHRIEVTPEQLANFNNTGTLNYPNGTGDGSHSLTSFQNTWDSWRHTVTEHPMQLIGLLFDGLKRVVGYVVWNYVDFAAQFKLWDGTLWGLMKHTELLWRSLVTAVITFGLFEIGPLLGALAEWIRIFVDLVKGAFHLAVEAVEALWSVLGRLWDDLVYLTYRLNPF